MRIRHKIILSIYLVLFPMLILSSGFSYFQSRRSLMEENTRRYNATVQAIGDSIVYFEQDLTDILTYFAVDDGIIRVLSGGVSSSDRLFWESDAPMQFIRSVLAIKSQITTLALYPENGLAPFYVSRDASVPLLEIEEVRKLDIYSKTIEAQGDVIWGKEEAGQGGESLFTYNKTDKILLCREIFDLSKKERLGFLFLSVHIQQYERICENALLNEDDTVIILGEDSVRMFATRDISPNPEQDYIFMAERPDGGNKILYISPRENWNKLANQTLTGPAILGVVLLLSIWPLSIIASRSISRPLNRLYNSMNRFKEGDFEHQIDIVGNDEIAELAGTFNTMVRDLRELINRNYVMVLRERESELTALQAQINPHFLYNALDSLYWQAIDAGQEKLAEDVLSLSELFRLLLSSGQSEIPVERELSIVSRYLNIQKMRFSKKLDYSIDVSEEILALPILKLVIQPFVENAIVHGLERINEQGLLTVTGRIENDMMSFTIEDNGTGMTDEQLSRVLSPEEDKRYARHRIGHYAISNVKERLDLRYEGRFSLDIESAQGEGTKVTLKIPVLSGNKEENNDDG
ncbi:MAG: sensor histidine kinase [Clostridiales bacterium]|nr:sensor histidine kinase [Clostridiales bacterium]